MQNAKVYLDSIAIQVDTNGVQPHKISIVDDLRQFMSRPQQLGVREDDGTIGFEVTMLSGLRRHVKYGPAGDNLVTVPASNNALVDQIYGRKKITTYDVSGTGLNASDAAHFYQKYKATQEAWANRAKLLAMISDPEITRSKRDELISSFLTADTAIEGGAMPLQMFGNTYNVVFAEGQSCNFTNWVIVDYTDFKFTLVIREAL